LTKIDPVQLNPRIPPVGETQMMHNKHTKSKKEETSMSQATQIPQVSTLQELEAVLKSEKQVIALVYSTWCPFCQAFLPIFKKYAQERKDCLLVRDDSESIADHYAIEVIPTVLYFEDGVLKKRLDGALGKGLGEKELVDFLSAVSRP